MVDFLVFMLFFEFFLSGKLLFALELGNVEIASFLHVFLGLLLFTGFFGSSTMVQKEFRKEVHWVIRLSLVSLREGLGNHQTYFILFEICNICMFLV